MIRNAMSLKWSTNLQEFDRFLCWDHEEVEQGVRQSPHRVGQKGRVTTAGPLLKSMT